MAWTEAAASVGAGKVLVLGERPTTNSRLLSGAERSGARSSSAFLTPTQHSLMRKAEVTPDSENRSNSRKAEMEFCRDPSSPAQLTFHNDGLGGGGRQGNGVVIAAFGAEGVGLVHLPGEGSAGRTRHTRSNVRFPLSHVQKQVQVAARRRSP